MTKRKRETAKKKMQGDRKGIRKQVGLGLKFMNRYSETFRALAEEKSDRSE